MTHSIGTKNSSSQFEVQISYFSVFCIIFDKTYWFSSKWIREWIPYSSILLKWWLFLSHDGLPLSGILIALTFLKQTGQKTTAELFCVIYLCVIHLCLMYLVYWLILEDTNLYYIYTQTWLLYNSAFCVTLLVECNE